MFDLESVDPDGVLTDATRLPKSEVAQISNLMNALADLRATEDAVTEASTKYMDLNRTDMRALHYLIVCQNRGEVATPTAIAHHLGISTASTTKLLDRLEEGGHIVRKPHPTDRRALAIDITPATKQAAMETVGKHQARRFKAAERLTPQERDVVLKFLQDMSAELDITGADWAQGRNRANHTVHRDDAQDQEWVEALEPHR